MSEAITKNKLNIFQIIKEAPREELDDEAKAIIKEIEPSVIIAIKEMALSRASLIEGSICAETVPLELTDSKWGFNIHNKYAAIRAAKAICVSLNTEDEKYSIGWSIQNRGAGNSIENYLSFSVRIGENEKKIADAMDARDKSDLKRQLQELQEAYNDLFAEHEESKRLLSELTSTFDVVKTIDSLQDLLDSQGPSKKKQRKQK